jgi:hypothetical protein
VFFADFERCLHLSLAEQELYQKQYPSMFDLIHWIKLLKALNFVSLNGPHPSKELLKHWVDALREVNYRSSVGVFRNILFLWALVAQKQPDFGQDKLAIPYITQNLQKNIQHGDPLCSLWIYLQKQLSNELKFGLKI